MNKNLVTAYYQGNNAKNYEQNRNVSQKWQFEENVVIQILRDYQNEILSIADAPVGSGRFFALYDLFAMDKLIFAYDYSADMIEQARIKTRSKKINFFQHDIIHVPLLYEADLSICFRFLNLIDWTQVNKVIENLFKYSKKFILLSIRLVEEFNKENIIEDKIHLHKKKHFLDLIRESDYEVKKTFEFVDSRVGIYYIFLLEKKYDLINSRIAKSGRLIYFQESRSKKHKTFQCFNVSHANFVKKIMTHSKLRKIFPCINYVENEWVDVEWINGEEPQSSVLTYISMVNILNFIQTTTVKTTSHFDYVKDLLIPRFTLILPLVENKSICRDTVDVLLTKENSLKGVLSHPDLSRFNLIASDKGIKIIDNELLCYTKHYKIDILNFISYTPEEFHQDIIKEYKTYNPDAFDDLEYLSSLWVIRQVGSFIVRNKVKEALKLLYSYEKHEWILPFNQKLY